MSQPTPKWFALSGVARACVRKYPSVTAQSIASLAAVRQKALYCDARGETTIAAADSLNLSLRAKRKLYGDVYHLPY